MSALGLVTAFAALCAAISSYGDIPIEGATDVAAVMSLGVVYIIAGLLVATFLARCMDGVFAIIAAILEWWNE